MDLFSHWSWNPNFVVPCMILLRDFEPMLCCREIKTLVKKFQTTPHKIQKNLFKKGWCISSPHHGRVCVINVDHIVFE